MSQILLRLLSTHSHAVRGHNFRRLSSAVYGGGRRRSGAGAAPPQDDESNRAVRVSVWWDFENCNVPNGVNAYRVAPRVSAALRAAGIRGPLSITAFGDVMQLARSSQEALAATGVTISHVPSSGKNSSDRSFMADLVYWIAQNPPPVHFFLISGDRDFANILHRLRMSNYNVLLACPSSATSVLCSAATIMWPWEGLVRGEDLSPKRFNHPPDGLQGSWYGHYRGALDDPSLEKESKEPIKVASHPNHFTVPSNNTNDRSVPKHVTNAILEVLSSYPEGINMSALRTQLIENGIYLGIDYFGHKKFSCLLQSMPDVVKLVGPWNAENEPVAIPANKPLLQPGDRALHDPILEKESEEPIKVPSLSQHCPVPSDTKPSSVPKHVRNAILEVLHPYPEGVYISRLRTELMKKKIHLEPDFFGHNKFSWLLQSMPDIVELVDLETHAGYAIAVNRRSLQPGDGSTKTLSSDQCNVSENNPSGTAHTNKKHALSSSQSIDRSRSFTDTPSEHPPTFSILTSPSNGLSEDQNECPVADVSGLTESPAKHREVDEMIATGTPSSSGIENATNEGGFFKRIWTMWNGPENLKSEVSQNCESSSAEVVDDSQTPLEECNSDQRRKLLRIHKTSSKNDRSDGTESTAAVSDNLSISSGDGPSEKTKRDPSIPENLEPCRKHVAISMGMSGKKEDISETNWGPFNWARWWTFGKSDTDSSTTIINATDEPKTDSIEEFESSNAPTCASAQQVVHEIFTKPALWAVLEQQLSEPLGSEVVLKAKTREELAHGLRKLNCWPLKDLIDKDLHHLVHLLISEKKWIEETSSRRFPFCLTLPHERKCVPSSSSKSNGLSSIFSSGRPQKGKYVNDNSRKSKSLTREEILSDCHKLLKELLSESEYGFNIGIFKRRFTEKYRYELDHRKLGYPDLESLLQIMPDATVKFPRVMASEHGNSHGGSKGNGKRSNGDDLIWEELGPVFATTEIAAAAAVDKEICYCPPTPSDDEFSDSDSVKDHPRRNAEQQSSLLQIIGSWNSSKGDGSSKKSQDIDGLVDCSRSSPSNVDSMASGKAQMASKLSHKQYSFVSDSGQDSEPDKLVESVLGSLQKARGSKLHN